MTEGIIYVLKEKSNESKKILEIYRVAAINPEFFSSYF